MEISNVGSTSNYVRGDQINVYYQVPSANLSKQPTPLRPFIDAPVDLLSIHFTGRTEELLRIKETFDAGCGDVPIRCVIYGMHGIGKSQLALYFAKSAFEQGHYQYVLWVSATTVEKLHRGIVKLLDLIDHKDRSHANEETRLMAARRWLEGCPANWLLVLDNVELDSLDFLREHLPHLNQQGNILFTTRTESLANTLASAAGQQHQVLELCSPNVHDAAKLLLRHIQGDADDAIVSKAKDVASCVGCLPLAVAQAGSFMKETGTNLDKMLNLYKSEHKIEVCYMHIPTVLPTLIVHLKVMNWENKLSDYEVKSVATTFTSQLEDLTCRSPDASNLLKLLSFLDPESISLDMIIQGAEVVSSGHPIHQIVSELSRSPEATSVLALIRSPIGLPSAITQLQNRSLVKRQDDGTTSALYMHDLIQFMVQEDVKKGGGEARWFEFAVELISGALARIEDPQLPQYWAECELFVSHIHSLTDRQDMYGSTKTWNLLMKGKEWISDYLHSRGWYIEAEALLARVLASKMQVLGPQHIDTLETQHRLACAHQMQGRYKEAETLYTCVLGGREKHLGVEHPDTLKTMGNLANVCRSQGRYSDAEQMHGHVLAARQMHLGVGHPATLLTMNNLANVYQSQGRYSDAEDLFGHVMVTQQKHLGVEHPDTLRTTNNLANVYEYLGRYGDAEQMHGRVLAARRKHLGVEHPDTLRTMGNLAVVYQSQGRYGDAEDMFGRVLVTQQKHLGVEHPNTISTMDNLAVVYQSQGRYTDAENMFRRVLVAQQKHLGVEHPDTFKTMNNLANVYRSQGQYSDAEQMHGHVLAARQKHLGVGHPATLSTMNNLANVYYSQGRYSDAEDLFGHVLVAQQKHLGIQHPDTLSTLNNLANVYQSQGRYDDAEQMYGHVLAARQKHLGVEHPHAILTMGNLAGVYQSQGRYSDAEDLFGHVLITQQKHLGVDHPNTLWTMHNLADVYQSQGRYSDAEDMFGRVLVARQKLLGIKHPDTTSTMDNLAVIYQSQGRYGDAEDMFGRILATQQKHLGANHPDTLRTMHNLAYTYQSQDRYSDAEEMCDRVLAVQEKHVRFEHPRSLDHQLLRKIAPISRVTQ
jgi:tetratricopeptide (TPR) repeat protein